jgi:hypothetical protein
MKVLVTNFVIECYFITINDRSQAIEAKLKSRAEAEGEIE